MTETLVAGRELDMRVSEIVFDREVTHPLQSSAGFWLEWTGTPESDEGTARELPHYSTDIGAAWEVVEKMDAHKFEVDRFDGRSETVYTPDGKTFYSQEVHPAVPYYKVNILCQSQKYYGSWHGSAIAKADTAPLAICLAALRAVAALQPVEK